MSFELKEGEVICPACHGNSCLDNAPPDETLAWCNKCSGKGKVDWIAGITDREEGLDGQVLTIDTSGSMAYDSVLSVTGTATFTDVSITDSLQLSDEVKDSLYEEFRDRFIKDIEASSLAQLKKEADKSDNRHISKLMPFLGLK